MLLAAASDIHGMWDKIKYPQADVLCLAGDILNNYHSNRKMDGLMQGPELSALDHFMGELIKAGTYKYVILVAGNHDFIFQEARQLADDVIENMIYLQDESTVIEGVKFYGSPWQPWFWDWAFNFPDSNLSFYRARAHARMCWDKVPTDTNVLITHSPPADILDETYKGENVGCKWLKERLQHLHKLKLHIFGHIHHSHGTKKISRTRFVNAAICSEHYKADNPIQVFKI